MSLFKSIHIKLSDTDLNLTAEAYANSSMSDHVKITKGSNAITLDTADELIGLIKLLERIKLAYAQVLEEAS